MSSSKGIRSWLNSKSKKQPISIQEQEERDLQRAIELSRQTQIEENEQRARLERLAERTLDIARRELHRHNESMSFVNGEEDNSFKTLTNRVPIKKEKGMASPEQRQRKKQPIEEVEEKRSEKLDAIKIKEEEEEKGEDDEIVFELADIDRWIAEEEEENHSVGNDSEKSKDSLASSPPSPFLHEFSENDKKIQKRSSLEYEQVVVHQDDIENQSNNEDDADYSLCPLCRKQVPYSLLYQHTLGCLGDPDTEDNDVYEDISNSNSLNEQQQNAVVSSPSRRRIDTLPTVPEAIKRKSAKSIAAGVMQEQKRQKSLNMSRSGRLYNHYSVHDAQLEEQFDSAGFGDNVSGLSWEARGQSRYR